MAGEMAFPVLLIASLMIVSSSLAEAFISNAVRFPPPYTKAACGPDVVAKAQTEGLLIGLPHKMWHSGRFCGKQVAVSCIGSGIPHAETQPCFKTSRLGGPVLTATVVEHATGNNLLLSELAFAKLAPIDSVLLSVNVTFLGITK